MMFQKGMKTFIQKDYYDAVKCFRVVAKQEKTDAQNGIVVEQDHAAALEWYHKAAKQNDKYRKQVERIQ